jgi:L,D-transpeptidase catalytic domain
MKIRRTLILTTLPLLAAVPAARGGVAVARSGSPEHRVSVWPSGADARAIETALLHAAPTMRPEALRAALSAWGALYIRGEIARPILTVIDYGLPSTVRRMWVFDLASRRLVFHELVAHGRNSGEDLARSFSNEEGSLMTSLGAFVTGATYNGRNGYSLRLRGMEPGLNDRAEARTIVIHGAPYVGEELAHRQGRLGRSYGCPAIRPAIARALIDEVKDRTLVYAWHPSIDKTEAPAGFAHTGAILGLLDALSHRSS